MTALWPVVPRHDIVDSWPNSCYMTLLHEELRRISKLGPLERAKETAKLWQGSKPVQAPHNWCEVCDSYRTHTSRPGLISVVGSSRAALCHATNHTLTDTHTCAPSRSRHMRANTSSPIELPSAVAGDADGGAATAATADVVAA